MAASPVGPVESVDHVVQRLDDNRGEQALDLVAEQRDQVGWPWTVGVFACTDDRAEGVGEHEQGDPNGPGGGSGEPGARRVPPALSPSGRVSSPPRHLEPATLTRVARGTYSVD